MNQNIVWIEEQLMSIETLMGIGYAQLTILMGQHY